MLLVLTAIDAPYQDVSLLWTIDWFVDRCRTTNNLLGDCYGAAVVAALSQKELEDMDSEKDKKKERVLSEEDFATAADIEGVDDCEQGGGGLKATWSQVTKVSKLCYKACMIPSESDRSYEEFPISTIEG